MEVESTGMGLVVVDGGGPYLLTCGWSWVVVDGSGHSWRLADAGGGQSLMVVMVDGGWWGVVVVDGRVISICLWTVMDAHEWWGALVNGGRCLCRLVGTGGGHSSPSINGGGCQVVVILGDGGAVTWQSMGSHHMVTSGKGGPLLS